jgi:hypothetical protein
MKCAISINSNIPGEIDRITVYPVRIIAGGSSAGSVVHAVVSSPGSIVVSIDGSVIVSSAGSVVHPVPDQ